MIISPKKIKVTYEVALSSVAVVETVFIPEEEDIIELEGKRYHVMTVLVRVARTTTHLIAQCANLST